MSQNPARLLLTLIASAALLLAQPVPAQAFPTSVATPMCTLSGDTKTADVTVSWSTKSDILTKMEIEFWFTDGSFTVVSIRTPHSAKTLPGQYRYTTSITTPKTVNFVHFVGRVGKTPMYNGDGLDVRCS